jgi:uncharacterized protein YkwD
LASIRIALAGALLTSAFALSAAAAAAPPEDEMIKEINRLRERHGEPPLRRSASLEDSSGRFAAWLVRRGYLSHRPSIGLAARFKNAGEVLSLHKGPRPRVRQTAQRWVLSTTHRTVLLSGRFRWIGVGHSRGMFGGRLTTIWAAQVASP